MQPTTGGRLFYIYSLLDAFIQSNLQWI